MKKSLFKQLKALRRSERYTALKACFQGWRQQGANTTPHGMNLANDALLRKLPSWLRLHDHATAMTLRKYQQVIQQVHKAIKEEDSKYYQAIAEQTQHTWTVEGLNGIWKHLRALLPKSRIKAQQPQHDIDCELQWHFEHLEAGYKYMPMICGSSASPSTRLKLHSKLAVCI